MVTVSAIELHGAPVITEVAPGASAEAGNVATPFTAVARDAKGHVLARVPIRAHEDHADAIGPRSEPIDQVSMQVQLPAASAASIQIDKGTKVLSTARAPRGRLRLSVSHPEACGLPAQGTAETRLSCPPGRDALLQRACLGARRPPLQDDRDRRRSEEDRARRRHPTEGVEQAEGRI